MKYQITNILKSYNYLSAMLAFVLWGTWAYFINIDSNNNFISAFSQGIASFIITLMMIKSVQYFYNIFPKNRLFFVLPSIITVGITSSVVVGIHLMVKTQNILFTVFPTVIVALLFALYTTKKISTKIIKKENRHV
jgi:hypothetical protein